MPAGRYQVDSEAPALRLGKYSFCISRSGLQRSVGQATKRSAGTGDCQVPDVMRQSHVLYTGARNWASLRVTMSVERMSNLDFGLYRESLGKYLFEGRPAIYFSANLGKIERVLLEVHEHDHWALPAHIPQRRIRCPRISRVSPSMTLA